MGFWIHFGTQTYQSPTQTDIGGGRNLKKPKEHLYILLGVKSYSINLQDEQVIIESLLPSGIIHQLLESTGRKAILRGHGSETGPGLYILHYN